MINVKRLNITLPKKLISRSHVLIDEGLYSNFSELVRESLKKEIILDQTLLNKKLILDKWFRDETNSGMGTEDLTQEELIDKIRRTRDELWEEKYKKWFERIS